LASARDIASALSGEGNGRSAASASADSAAAARRGRRRVWLDRLATLTVRAGGFGIIASILAILIFIVAQVLPLLSAATVEPTALMPLPGGEVRGLIGDPYNSHVASVALDGRMRVVRLRDQAIVAEGSLLPPPDEGAASAPRLVAAAVPPGSTLFTGATDSGDVVSAAIHWGTRFEGQERVASPELSAPVTVAVDPAHRPLGAYAVAPGEGDSVPEKEAPTNARAGGPPTAASLLRGEIV